MSVRKQHSAMGDLPGLFLTTLNSQPSTQAPMQDDTLPDGEWAQHVKGMERATEKIKRAEAKAERKVAAEYAKLITPNPLTTVLSDEELLAYRYALSVFKRIKDLYETGTKNSVYPIELKNIKYLVKYLPIMNEYEKIVMQNRLSQIERVLSSKTRPKREKEKNVAFLEVVEDFINRFQEIVDTQNNSPGFIESRNVARMRNVA